MNKITFLTFLSILCFISFMNAQEVQSSVNEYESFSEVDLGSFETNRNQYINNRRSIQVINNNGGTRVPTLYTDRPTFQAAFGGTLTLEDFGGGPGPGVIMACGLILSSAGDPCFPAGELEVGFNITSSGPNTNETVYIGTGALGNIIPIVGSNFFTDITSINFTVGYKFSTTTFQALVVKYAMAY